MLILEKFLPETYEGLKKYIRECDFKNETNPADGVTYPLICQDIPAEVKHEVEWYLASVIHRKPKSSTLFLRMSPAGCPCPHIFHNDSSMGDFSMMLYFEDRDDAGTGMARHIETKVTRPTQSSLQKCIRDQNDYSKWEVYSYAEMRENRAVIFDSSMFHCALPIGGYGSTQNDSRIVLTCFFS